MNDVKLSLALAEAVRLACLQAAREGYESAAMNGLCHEGAVEASLDAIRMLDLNAVVAAHSVVSQKKA
ncbi:MAG: acetyltransferase [Gammaproteobacteria bacterium]